MDSVDLQVLKTAAAWSRAGYRSTLSTVTRTWGSAPRPVGAMMLIRDDGLVVGSVSGGCIEDDLVERVKVGQLGLRKPELTSYGVSGDEARRFGLPCGGTLQLVMEPIGDCDWIADILGMLDRGVPAARTLDMQSGAVKVAEASADSPLCCFDGSTLSSSFGPRYRLLIIGGGQLSAYLAQVALGLDYQVTVCDPREEYADSWAVPGVTLTREMPDDAVIALQLDANCAVVALTHDPKLDDMALLEALKSPAFYVGALGSRANNARRRERLQLFDLTPEQIRRLHGPIGLYIGSRTPPEIAISILAEMTCIKNGVLPANTLRAPAQIGADGETCLA
ncbi:XdhC family protein [Herminiimonas sp. CN]|uniref:XdhC family protein n=1 Tax=Herminiimonas sp. CN TaxID=1349818 RepID=UPI0004733CCF|nr:XdhC family protein [Herminiimonas sp. CN]